MIKLLYIPTGNMFTLPDEEATIPFLSEKPNKRSEYINECKKHTYVGGVPSKCFAVFVSEWWKIPKELH